MIYASSKGPPSALTIPTDACPSVPLEGGADCTNKKEMAISLSEFNVPVCGASALALLEFRCS